MDDFLKAAEDKKMGMHQKMIEGTYMHLFDIS